jgi:hypothetical protein
LDQLVFWVSLTPDIGTLAWAPLNCCGKSPASRTTRAHSPALGRTSDYSDWEICHKIPNTEYPGRVDRGATWAGIEPATLRFAIGCSTTALPCCIGCPAYIATACSNTHGQLREKHDDPCGPMCRADLCCSAAGCSFIVYMCCVSVLAEYL